MALLSDGNISTLDDLKARETEILDIAATEGIDLTLKLQVAAEEVGIEVSALLLAEDEPGARELRGVVVTPALRQWHALRTLANTYRDAYHRQLNDRYEGKRRTYAEFEKDALATLRRVGIGMARQPVPRAEKPEIAESSNAFPAGTYYIRVSWTDQAGQEGEPSEPATFEGTGLAPEVKPTSPPQGAAGWSVYAGTADSPVRKQNDALLPIGGSWTPVGGLSSQGACAGDGQAPDYYVQPSRLLQRG